MISLDSKIQTTKTRQAKNNLFLSVVCIWTGSPDYVLNPDMEMPEIQLSGLDNASCIGTLKIPALHLELPVLSEWSYPLLRKAPCRYAGSAYKGNLVIAAHNYSSHFGQIKGTG